MKHLTLADYKTMPWANGLGQTVEILRVDGPGGLLYRLSMASVVVDGAFSVFPGIERNLTVISGPGFDLAGAVSLRCDPLVPVAFAGDVAVRAERVTAPSDDFNVMTARSQPRPVVTVERDGAVLLAGGRLCLFALGVAAVNGVAMAKHDLIVTEGPADIAGLGPVIAVRLTI